MLETTQQKPSPRRDQEPGFSIIRLYSGGILDEPAVPLRSGGTVVGREVADGISFPDDGRISRVHTTLFVEAGRGWIQLVDSSRNGTYVNGRQVKHAEVREGDVVRVGDSFLLVRRQGSGEDATLPRIVGRAPAVAALRARLARVAATGTMVLLAGESGAGKEVAARSLHEASGRSGELITVNASAIPEALAESQLFGHVAGAFTGARTAHPGFFRMAHGGTLFLDEIADLAPVLQPKLLRVLEERCVRPLGATAAVPLDVRLVTATNQDLERAVEAGKFRGDLYARIAEIVIPLPPLRARREDVLILLRQAMGGTMPKLTAELVEALLLHEWPYNVRELFKIAAELRIEADAGRELDVTSLSRPLASRAAAPAAPTAAAPAAGAAAGDDDEDDGADEADDDSAVPAREELEALLQKHHGNVAAIARERKRSRKQVYRWMTQYGLDRNAYR